MSGNRVVVHKRHQVPTRIDQLGTTIPMLELLESTLEKPSLPKAKTERSPRLVPISMAQANSVGDMPQSSLAARTIHAIVFDLDSTLVDLKQWRETARARALALFGFELHSGLKSSAVKGSPSTAEILDHLSRDSGLPRSLHGLITRLEHAGIGREIEASHPDSEKEYLLMRLGREGYRLAVCSGMDRPSTMAILERARLQQFFDVVVTSEEIRTAKPSPETYLSACDRLGLRPNQVAVVESTPQGIDSARRAGAYVLPSEGVRDVEWIRIRKLVHQIEIRSTGVASC